MSLKCGYRVPRSFNNCVEFGVGQCSSHCGYTVNRTHKVSIDPEQGENNKQVIRDHKTFISRGRERERPCC